MRHDLKADRAWPGRRRIRGNWPGLPDAFTRGVDAALNRRDKPAVGYLFKDDQDVRYDLSADRTDSGYPKPVRGNRPFFG